ncbi:metallophosphoesterase [Maribacter halichondriae]|uniref:metallophosphoesterase n=1 Tax=Maribacter halichondriae TaxID=2980554 RepID=UPI0023599931|nr:metallophosphoesterase [Maribacter sp. Hal144]
MKRSLDYTVFRIVFLWLFLVIAASCGSKSDDSVPPIEVIEEEEVEESIPPVVFTAIGDVPYDDEQRTDLINMVTAHNAQNKSEFIIHVGDIKRGADPCDETVYEDVSTILKGFDMPTFVVLGDNEFNTCADPDQGLEFWNQYFLHFNENWQFAHTVLYQTERAENFSWVENKVLFVGINLVGIPVHDQEEWDERLADDAKWVSQLLEEHKEDTEATVIFAQANIVNLEPDKFNIFTDVFRAASATYAKPILYLHGDGHFWIENRPWAEKNILRVQIVGGSEAAQVTVDTSKENPFSFDSSFLE